MEDLLFEAHRGLGYLVAAVLLVVAGMAFGRARDAREFSRGPYAAAMVLLDVQVLLGLVLYLLLGSWDPDRVLVAYVHPLLALLALGGGHALLSRARGHQQVVEAHRTAGRGLLAAFALALAAVAVATIG